MDLLNMINRAQSRKFIRQVKVETKSNFQLNISQMMPARQKPQGYGV